MGGRLYQFPPSLPVPLQQHSTSPERNFQTPLSGGLPKAARFRRAPSSQGCWEGPQQGRGGEGRGHPGKALLFQGRRRRSSSLGAPSRSPLGAGRRGRRDKAGLGSSPARIFPVRLKQIRLCSHSPLWPVQERGQSVTGWPGDPCGIRGVTSPGVAPVPCAPGSVARKELL